MAVVRRTRRADTDLIEIWRFIAADSRNSADRLLDDIELAWDRLADFPHLGRARSDLGRDIRLFPVRSYLILYRISDHEIEVVRVLHGAREIKDIE